MTIVYAFARLRGSKEFALLTSDDRERVLACARDAADMPGLDPDDEGLGKARQILSERVAVGTD